MNFPLSVAPTKQMSHLHHHQEILHGVHVVGQVGHPQAKVVRIVHLSDTRGYHLDYKDNIPMGHILIHSGDFSDSSAWRNGLHGQRERERLLNRLNYFFKQQPHPYKIFVAGDGDSFLHNMSPRDIQQHLSSAIYLQDSSCKLLGLRIYGTPWNSGSLITNLTHGFSASKKQVVQHWKNIPSDTDILITHMTPWNSRKLYEEVTQSIQPIVHLFSDDKAGPGINWKDHILFSNGAMYGKHACSRDGRRHTVGCIHQPHMSYTQKKGFRRHSSHSMEASQRYVNMQSNECGAPPNPIVIDVYVVADEFSYIELPNYVSDSSPHLNNSTISNVTNEIKNNEKICLEKPSAVADQSYDVDNSSDQKSIETKNVSQPINPLKLNSIISTSLEKVGTSSSCIIL